MTAVLHVMNCWAVGLGSARSADMVYVEFAKAYDRVCHTELIAK